MSRETGHYSASANTALFVTAAVIIFCIGGSIMIAFFIEDPEARIGLISLMLSQIPIAAGILRVLVITDKVDVKADAIHEKTDRVLNGEMDAKIREAARIATRAAIEERWGKPDGWTKPENEPPTGS